MKLFGTSDNDYDVVALVLGPDEMGSDALGLRLRCNKTGQVRGRVVDEESIYWNLMKRYFAPGFHTSKLDYRNSSNFPVMQKEALGPPMICFLR